MPIRSGGSYVLRGGEPVRVAHSGSGQQVSLPKELPQDTQAPASKQRKSRNEQKETAHASHTQADASGSA
ncbi:hypothetical protein [Halomonas sp. GT]|uniref:hypothetical protein n=1 Tax=Halomonas sp. GT TaxID=1971364 RepID=UPI0009F52760|nr:hypothetical protein [Halomonas sp. GT]